jgi:hypothetical protein
VDGNGPGVVRGDEEQATAFQLEKSRALTIIF